MNVLISSAGSELAQELVKSLSGEHQIRLTDLVEINTNLEFFRNDLDHGKETNKLVRGMDTVIHLAQIPPELLSKSDHPENLIIDFQTRCSYNLIQAACEEGVNRIIYASSLRLFDQHEEDWAVTEIWRPKPTTDIPVLSSYLGEFVCREFSRENRIQIFCLRLGKLIRTEPAKTSLFDSTWLEMGDAVQAFKCALRSDGGPWEIFHIQSEFPNARFLIDRAKENLDYKPQFHIEE